MAPESQSASPSATGADTSNLAAECHLEDQPGPSSSHPGRKRPFNEDQKHGKDKGSRDTRNRHSRAGRDRRPFTHGERDTKRPKTDTAATGAEATTTGDNGDANAAAAVSEGGAMEPQDAEPRKPKRKVAVLISYAGTGYKGMQINNHERTIEGDLFAAFVAAGLVSRANSVDPRKVSLSRCARTDKGVHAAGNVVSLKLILEGGDLVRRINEKLPPQIRVWDVLRTNNNFNCYSQCDSRRYEYLLPSYCLLPPHPGSYLGKRIIEEAKKKGEAALEEVRARWKDVEGYWEKVDREEIWPILRALDDETRREVLSRMHDVEEVDGKWEGTRRSRSRSRSRSTTPPPPPVAASRDEGVTPKQEERAASQDEPMPDAGTEAVDKVQADGGSDIATKAVRDAVAGDESAPAKPGDAEGPNGAEEASAALTPAEVALRAIRNVYRQAKRRYRVTPTRLAQLQQVLDLYKGTHSFHNYTVSMSLKDASARRHIKSFVATPEPVVVGDTEWLSLRVHGQSFMMHQIRKMVAMAVLIVRCAADLSRIAESYGPARISIPKAPGLGLLLERPLFHGYNKRARESLGVQEIDFDRYKEQIDEFKHREIYSRVWEGEEKENAFQIFFHQLDNFKSDYFAWVTAGGIESAKLRTGRTAAEKLGEATFDDGEDENPEGGDG